MICFKDADLDDMHVRGLRTLGPFGRLEADSLTFGERLEALRLDLREVYKQVTAVLLLDKAVAFLIGEPFDCSFWQGCSSLPIPVAEYSNHAKK